MGFYSAQLNDSGVVVAVVDSTETITGAKVIAIESFDSSLAGKKYNAETQKFEVVPPTPEQTEEALIQAEIAKLKEADEAALRAEAITTLTADGKISVVTK